MNAQDFEKKIRLKREYIKILINLQSVGNGKMLGVLPSELLPAKVAVARGLAVDGVLEVQVLEGENAYLDQLIKHKTQLNKQKTHKNNKSQYQINEVETYHNQSTGQSS